MDKYGPPADDIPCCRMRIGLLPGVGAPVNIHTADCTRLDDLVMEAWLKGHEPPTGQDGDDDPWPTLAQIVAQYQALLDNLWALRSRWLNRVIGPETRTAPAEMVTLEQAAEDLRQVLGAHGE